MIIPRDLVGFNWKNHLELMIINFRSMHESPRISLFEGVRYNESDSQTTIYNPGYSTSIGKSANQSLTCTLVILQAVHVINVEPLHKFL